MTKRVAEGEVPGASPHGNGKERVARCVGSAVWAAYGDAIGFLSELTDPSGLDRRTRGRALDQPFAWTRRIGGRQGVNVELPAGCYSDDTQLRLSVGRAIGPDGFDVEAFAKVEVTVWPTYALGGGTGTKAAAANLCKDNVSWYANTFKGWTNAGGNGAAMRIQPHVWAASNLDDPSTFLPDVVRDSICTHGSPTGILGAVLHSLHVAHTISRGEFPSPTEAKGLLKICQEVPDLLTHDSEVEGIWMGLWQRETGNSFRHGWEIALKDAHAANALALASANTAQGSYGDLLKSLDLFSPTVRGSGLLTSIAALALLWHQPAVETALVTAANAIGSDTDTIGTMAGAIAGALSDAMPEYPILDLTLIRSESARLAGLGQGGGQMGHQYPDLLHWAPPRTQADAVVQGKESIEVLGLGPVHPKREDADVAENGSFQWQWLTTTYGQTLLAKRRIKLPMVLASPSPTRKNEFRNIEPTRGSRMSTAVQPTLMDKDETHHDPHTTESRIQSAEVRPLNRGVNLDDVLEWLASGRLNDDQALGYVIRRVARDGTPEQMLLLVGALRERLRS